MTEKPLMDKNTERARNIYALFALGGVSSFSGITFLILCGTLAITVGIFMAYSGRRKTEDPMLETHFTWQIRTFWIGNLVIVPVAMILNLYLLYQFTDIDVMLNTAASGGYGMDVVKMQETMIAFEKENGLTLLTIKLVTYGLALLWWLSRCGMGYKALKISGKMPVAKKQDDE